MKKTILVIMGMMLLGWFIAIIVLALCCKHIPPVVFIILGTLMVLDVLLLLGLSMIPVSHGPIEFNPISPSGSVSYSDNLIRINENEIKIKLFYFPFGSKRIKFPDIEIVQAYKGGCLRLWGSGDFRTWFGLDWGRMNREITFIITRKNKWSRIGFTCKDSQYVAGILRSKNLLQIQ